MVRMRRVFKAGWLLYIYFLVEWSVEESSLDIHLEQLKTFVRGESYQESDGLKTCDRGICFIIVNALLLIVTRCYQSRFVPYDNTRVVELVAENPSSADDGLTSRAWNKSSDFITLELL